MTTISSNKWPKSIYFYYKLHIYAFAGHNWHPFVPKTAKTNHTWKLPKNIKPEIAKHISYETVVYVCVCVWITRIICNPVFLRKSIKNRFVYAKKQKPNVITRSSSYPSSCGLCMQICNQIPRRPTAVMCEIRSHLIQKKVCRRNKVDAELQEPHGNYNKSKDKEESQWNLSTLSLLPVYLWVNLLIKIYSPVFMGCYLKSQQFPRYYKYCFVTLRKFYRFGWIYFTVLYLQVLRNKDRQTDTENG